MAEPPTNQSQETDKPRTWCECGQETMKMNEKNLTDHRGSAKHRRQLTRPSYQRVPGWKPQVQPADLLHEVDGERTAAALRLQVPVQEVVAIMTQLWDEVSGSSATVVGSLPTLRLPAGDDAVPYPTDEPGVVLSCGDEGGGVSLRAGRDERQCCYPNCNAVVPAKKMLLHVGKHVLAVNKSYYAEHKKDNAFELCGFCGSIGKCTAAIITKNERGNACAACVGPTSCQNGCGYTVGIVKGMQVSKSNPCTNLPVQCPLPGCNTAVWRYSWVAHLTARHAAEAANPSWRNHESFVITGAELEAMATLQV